LPTPLPLEISTCNIVEVLEDEQGPKEENNKDKNENTKKVG
jgi:hypothetical protein